MPAKISFEKALLGLEDIIEKMESGNITLDKSIKYYKDGMKLAKLCSDKLDEAEKEIKILQEN